MDNYDLLQRLASSLPIIAAWIAGICICVNYRKNQPMASTLLTAAFVLFIIDIIAINLLQSWLLFNAQDKGIAVSLSWNFAILHIAGTLVNLIGWILILVGVYQLFQNSKAFQDSK